jgi:hypothetical protein
MTLVVKAATAGLALALAFGGASVVADAHTSRTHPANHGAAVSAVAHSDSTTGEAHGDAVSAVARSNAGSTGNSISAIASGFGATISALAHATTGADRSDTISDAAQMHGKTVSAAAKAK